MTVKQLPWKCLIVCSFVTYVVTQATFCTRHQVTPAMVAPPPPVLPDQYQTTIEANIEDDNATLTAQEYFDYRGNRATLKVLRKQVIHMLVFDYLHDQLFSIVGSLCKVSELKGGSNTMLFGDNITSGVPHVLTSSGALHFTKQSGQVYLGRTRVRGILCDQWRSCLYWPQLASNFTLDYFFTVYNWSDPVGYPQIPVRALAQGVQAVGTGSRNFIHYYDYFDFRPYVTDMSIFETPRGVICPGRKQIRPLPQLPQYFHYRQEIYIEGTSDVFIADVWYDGIYRLVRFDYRTPKPITPSYTRAPLSEIHDYNYGIRYIIDKQTKQCMAVPLSNSSFDVAEDISLFKLNGSYVLHMKDPMTLFGLDDSYAYTGQRTARGLLCDVFTTIKHDYTVPDVAQKVQAVFEYYFLSGMNELPDDGSTSPSAVPVRLDITVDAIGYYATYNFLDFSEDQPNLLTYIGYYECYSESAKLQFRLRFPGQYIHGIKDVILSSAQRQISAAMGISPVRLQALKIDYDNSQMYISATLIDRTPYAAQFTFLSSKEIERQDDRNFTSAQVSTVEDCAKVCVQNADFTCNSFDYCTSDPIGSCRISRAHIADGKTVLIKSKCNHFSRTVTGPVKPELSLSDAYNNLVSAVYSGNVHLMLYAPLAKQSAFTAVDCSVIFGWLLPTPLPTLTGQFSYLLEMTVPRIQKTVVSRIWYDYDFRLVRIDYIRSQNHPNLPAVQLVTSIQDYNSGLQYVIDKKSGSCTMEPLQNTTFATTTTQTPGGAYVIKMKNPLDVFYLSDQYRYSGQRTVRGILCDVFENVVDNYHFGDSSTPIKAVFQYYFVSKSWHEFSEDSGMSVTSQPISLVVSAVNGGFTETYHFYDFNEQHPDLSNFNIQPCFHGNQQQHFLLKFNQSYHPTLDSQLKTFQKKIQMLLAITMKISPLRLQNPQITYRTGITYYIATIIEQPPFLLDFTLISGHLISSHWDKTFNGAESIDKCAALCRNETSFNCQAFDFCPEAQSCGLTKTHDVSNVLQNYSVVCDHFSRTVSSASREESTNQEALSILQQKVNTRQFTVSVSSSKGPVGYTAIMLDEDIMRYDRKLSYSPTMSHFQQTAHTNIEGYNNLQLEGVSVDDCAARCLSEKTFDCESFDYCPDIGLCELSVVHPDRNTSLVSPHHMCDLYARLYLDKFKEVQGLVQIVTKQTTTVHVASANLCAKQCIESKNFTCKSFDFCVNTQTCHMSQTRNLSTTQHTQAESSSCSHFSRQYISDFQQTAKQEVTVKQYLSISSVSPDDCAAMCIENSRENSACRAFTYCNDASQCRLYGQTNITLANIAPSAACDVYIRTFYSPSPAPSPLSLVNNAKITTSYSSGAMAGVGVAMFFVGMVFGAALLYLKNRWKLKPMHSDLNDSD